MRVPSLPRGITCTLSAPSTKVGAFGAVEADGATITAARTMERKREGKEKRSFMMMLVCGKRLVLDFYVLCYVVVKMQLYLLFFVSSPFLILRMQRKN